MQEAEDARRAGPERNGAIRDLRHLTWFSIDNDDTRDLDQLSVAESLPAGITRLLVAVADVDCMVRPGGAMDGHAGINTTSVYTAAGVFPMLPEALSTDLTSLHEGRERLALVVDMRVQADGLVSESEIYRAAVLNRAKLTYDSVSAWLDGAGPPPPQLARVPGLEDQLRLTTRWPAGCGKAASRAAPSARIRCLPAPSSSRAGWWTCDLRRRTAPRT